MSQATSSLGLTSLLLADSARTGESVLAHKGLGSGALVMGLVADLSAPMTTPLTSLENVLAQLGTAVTPLTSAKSVSVASPSGSLNGVMMDLLGDPGGLVGAEEGLRTRILLFTPMNLDVTPNGNTQTVFLFTATNDTWSTYEPLFALMLQTIIVYDVRSGFSITGGTANVVGELMPGNTVHGNLSQGRRDVWTFAVSGNHYATIRLVPDVLNLDLTLTLIGSSGETIATIDSGYEGDTEIATDVLLSDGRYLAEIADFSLRPGKYTLSLDLHETPQYSGGGPIQLGQSIRNELPVNGTNIWLFDGVAGQAISAVVQPAPGQDAILDLYGPDGNRLVALDEGFSGDAEVIAGFQLPLTGQYAVMVRSFAGESGAYTLTLTESEEEVTNFYDAGDLVYGGMAMETLQPHEAHAWFFEGKAGDEVMVAVLPLAPQLDLEAWLLDPDVQLLVSEDAFPAGKSELIDTKLPADGQYIILVQDFNGAAGMYEIMLTAIPSITPINMGSLTLGQPVSGTLAAEDVVSWAFVGKAMEVVHVTLTPTDGQSDLLFWLQDPNGRRVATVDGAAGDGAETLTSFVLPQDGEWHIVLKSFFAEPGTYTLLVENTP